MYMSSFTRVLAWKFDMEFQRAEARFVPGLRHCTSGVLKKSDGKYSTVLSYAMHLRLFANQQVKRQSKRNGIRYETNAMGVNGTRQCRVGCDGIRKT